MRFLETAENTMEATPVWGFIWWFFMLFVFIAYLFVLFAIVGDIFRDRELNGWLKALWIIFLVFVPFLTALIYLIARGQSMNRRATGAAAQARAAQEEYIRSVATPGSSAADEIAKAKAIG